MKPHRINQLAVWAKMASNGLDVKVFADNYRYLSKNGLIMKSSEEFPVYRYAKNYKLEDGRVSLCLITQDHNTKQVEAWMDKRAKKLKIEDITKPFTLLDVYYE